MKQIRALLVDDNDSIRKSFLELLSNIPNLNVVKECVSGVELMESINHHLTHVVFMNIIIKDMTGIEATRRLKKKFPFIKVIAFVLDRDNYLAKEMKKSGADGLVSKFDANEEIIISELKKIGFSL